MKHPIIPGLLCAALVILGGLPASGQNQEPKGPPPKFDHGKPGKHGGKERGGLQDGPGNLTPDEAKRLGAAREKAMEDPTVRSLREARDAVEDQLQAAMTAAMISADPSLAPILEKVQNARGRAKDLRDRFESLSPQDKKALNEARKAAKDDPAVVAARQKAKEAKTPEERMAAGKAMFEAMKAAMIKQNPALASLLEKLGPPPPHRGPGGPDGLPMGPPGGEFNRP
jgi:hypothetical protein